MSWGIIALCVTAIGIIIVALALLQAASDHPPSRDGFWMGVFIASAPWLCILLAWSRL